MFPFACAAGAASAAARIANPRSLTKEIRARAIAGPSRMLPDDSRAGVGELDGLARNAAELLGHAARGDVLRSDHRDQPPDPEIVPRPVADRARPLARSPAPPGSPRAPSVA